MLAMLESADTSGIYLVDDTATSAGDRRELAIDELVEFLAVAARALHANGAPVHQLEGSLVACASALGHAAQVFATPTSIDIAVGATTPSRQQNHLIRAGAGAADLARLVAIDRVLLDVREQRITLDEGRARIEIESARAPVWSEGGLILGFAMTSAGAAYFFGGCLADLLLSFIVGGLLGLLSVIASGRPGLGQLYDVVSTFAATLASLAVAALIPGVSAQVVAIAGLVVLLPGLSLTLALSEIATKHLVSGTSRLAGSLSVFACMAVGVGLARSVAAHFGLEASASALGEASIWFSTLPTPVRWAALIISPIGWAICWQTRVADLPAIVVTGVVANEVCRLVGESMGPETAAFASALVVGLAANAYAQWRALPRDVVLQPCLLLLVPGSMGFRGMTSLMNHQVDSGVETIIGVAVIASTLVAGVLVANCVRLPIARATLEPATDEPTPASSTSATLTLMR